MEYNHLDNGYFDSLNNNLVTLIVSNERYSCDKNALQHSSAYFQAMFNSSMLESTAKEIPIHDVDPVIFKILLDFAETGHLTTSTTSDFNSICDVLKSACIFQFDEVSKKCAKFLASMLDISNCCKIWELADFLNLTELRFQAKNLSLYKGDHLLQSEDILNASFDIFLDLISSDLLNVKSEVNVFRSVVRYTKENDLDEAKTAVLISQIRAQDFIGHERFALRNHHFVQQQIRELRGCLNRFRCNCTADSQLELCNSFKDSRSNNVMAFTHSGNSRSIPLKPLLYGYSFQGRKNKLNVHLYIQKDNSFHEMTSICVHFKTLVGFGVCVVGSDVYMFGGREKVHYGKWNQQMWKYNSLKNYWTELPRITFVRRHFMCIALGKRIYVVGGYGELRLIQSSMLNYDTETGIWSENASPPESCGEPMVAAGKHNGSPALFYFSNCVYRFEPIEDLWTQLVNTCVAAGILSTVSYGDHIYLMTQLTEVGSTKLYLFDSSKAVAHIIATSLSEDCTSFTVANKQAFVYTDNGVEVINLPAVLAGEGSQFMFRWRSDQRKVLTSSLKYVGLLPFY